jgi:hypothetical protein
VAQLTPAGVPLRDELAGWAATLRLSPSQRKLLLAVNDWLRRTNGGNVPIAAAAERAYELIRDEKAFDSTPPRGGAQQCTQRTTRPSARCCASCAPPTPAMDCGRLVQGRNTAPSNRSLASRSPLPRLKYLGDLDAAGLAIGATACATAEAVGIPAGPAAPLWALLIDQPPRPDRRVP